MACKFKVGDVVVRSMYFKAYKYAALLTATGLRKFTVKEVVWNPYGYGRYEIILAEDPSVRKTRFDPPLWTLASPERKKVYK